jgi:hypothetical protein
VTARIDIIAPASISLLGSLVATPDPAALSVVDAAGGTVVMMITAGNAAARLSASGAAGAAVSSNANTLTLSGSVGQVNAALASLEVSDAGADVLMISASGAGVAAASTDIAVTEIPAAGPAFAAPPASFAMSPYSVTSIGGLVLADPAAVALAAAGLGRLETMAVTLSAASGVLFLPGLAALDGVSAAGVGTNEIILNFTADRLGAVNALLAGLEWAGPAAVSGLAYAARDVAGPLGSTVTSGNVVLDITGNQGPTMSLVTGADAAILGMTTLSLGSVLTVTGVEADIGGIFGAGSVFIAPGGALEVPYNLLSLGGTSYDFGTLNAATLALSGTLIAPGGVDVSGRLSVGAGSEIDFDGALIAGGGDTASGLLDLSLAAGALLTGSGDLVAGNFSESGRIAGAGTILAGAGDTLLIAAGEISGVTLAVAGGGVLELGAINPLYGVFDATALTIGGSVVLDFAPGGNGAGATGGFADTLGQAGGVIVITDAAGFSGRIVNFAPGDRLIFPGLSGLTLGNITASGFVVSGNDSAGVTQSYTISAAIPAGMSPTVGVDAEGDAEISLRDAQGDVFFGGVTVSQAELLAQPGIRQPLAGLDVLARSWNGQSVTVTLAVSHGSLSGAGVTQGAQVILSAANPEALNAALQSLSYTAIIGASFDILTISSGSGPLNGLFDEMVIGLSTGGGTIVGGFGDAAQVALFSDGNAVPVQGVAAPGALVVTGAKIFDASLEIVGLGGTALQVASGAVAIFDAGAALALCGDVTVAGGGLLADITEAFSVAGNVTVAGSVIIEGGLAASGSLMVGGSLVSAGTLSAAAATVAASGLVVVSGGTANLGALAVGGTLEGVGAAVIEAGSVTLAGFLSLGGTADFYAAGSMLAGGTLEIGPDAGLFAPGLSQTGGVMVVDGMVSLAGGLVADGVVTLAGGTLLAPFVSLQPGAVLSGGGVVGAAGSLGVLLANGAGLTASGNLLLADDVTLANGAAITLAASSALDVAHIVTGGSIAFAGAGAALTINDVGQFSAAVTGMVDHDAVDLVGVAPSLVSFAGGEVSVAGVGQFALAVAGGQPAVSLGADGAGGTLITLGGDMPCFARGTRLLTPNGYRQVEALKPGDPLINLGGERRGVRWIGWRTLDLKFHDRAGPVTFAPHALGVGVPRRAVTLSPLHAVFIGGVLVPACHLVNGATIVAPKHAAVTYYHVEMDRHEVLLADGMAVESYLDNGNRGQLYSEIGQRGHAAEPFAEIVTSGPALVAIRRRLHGIALQAGFRLTYEPAVRAVAGAASVLPRRVRRQLRFKFPAAAGGLGLVARAAAPAETDPDSEDRRQLAICISGFPDDVRPGDGWYNKARGDAGIWMGAGAALGFAGARTDLTLEVAGVIRSWVAPAPTIMRGGR